MRYAFRRRGIIISSFDAEFCRAVAYGFCFFDLRSSVTGNCLQIYCHGQLQISRMPSKNSLISQLEVCTTGSCSGSCTNFADCSLKNVWRSARYETWIFIWQALMFWRFRVLVCGRKLCLVRLCLTVWAQQLSRMCATDTESSRIPHPCHIGY